MAKKVRLKSRRTVEARKVDLAVKYAERGVATGGGRIHPKKQRRTLEARFLPVMERVPSASKKTKRGRHHPPPSTAPRSRAR